MHCAQTDETAEMPFGGRLIWAQGTMYEMGAEIVHMKGTFWGYPAH